MTQRWAFPAARRGSLRAAPMRISTFRLVRDGQKPTNLDVATRVLADENLNSDLRFEAGWLLYLTTADAKYLSQALEVSPHFMQLMCQIKDSAFQSYVQDL